MYFLFVIFFILETPTCNSNYVLFSRKDFLFSTETINKNISKWGNSLLSLKAVYLTVSVDKTVNWNYIQDFMWTCELNNYNKDDDLFQTVKTINKSNRFTYAIFFHTKRVNNCLNVPFLHYMFIHPLE